MDLHESLVKNLIEKQHDVFVQPRVKSLLETLKSKIQKLTSNRSASREFNSLFVPFLAELHNYVTILWLPFMDRFNCLSGLTYAFSNSLNFGSALFLHNYSFLLDQVSHEDWSYVNINIYTCIHENMEQHTKRKSSSYMRTRRPRTLRWIPKVTYKWQAIKLFPLTSTQTCCS